MKILIAHDGSNASGDVLKDLARAGFPANLEVVVISVVEEWFPPVPPVHSIVEAALVGSSDDTSSGDGPTSPAVEEAYALASQAARLIEREYPRWKVSTATRRGSPAREILKEAEDCKAKLIVIGSHGRTGFTRLVLGSVSQRVVTDSHCSVRIARAPDPSKPKSEPHRIAIGIDGSQGSFSAVSAVAARSWPIGTEVFLITSVDPLHIYALRPDDKFTAAEAAQAKTSEMLTASGLSVSSIVREADPRHLLIEEARRWQADCIFLGARGLGMLDRFFLGSVSTAVSARAPCSVEIVR